MIPREIALASKFEIKRKSYATTQYLRTVKILPPLQEVSYKKFVSKKKKKKIVSRPTKSYCICRELCSVLCGSMDGRRIWGRMDTCVCMAESLCCPPETLTTLLNGYTPISNKK